MLPGEGGTCCIRRVTQYGEGDRVVVDVERMAYGPHAVARDQGFVLFVRGAAPGDRAEVRIRERRRNHAFADVVGIERPSPYRSAPACPYAAVCGGCPWQHLDYAQQLSAKRDIVAEQLRRVAGLAVDVAPVIASPRVYGYRRRLKLRVEAGRVGFYAGGTHDLVRISHCLLAESAIDALIDPVSRLAGSLTARLRRLEIVDRHGGLDGLVLLGEVEGPWSASAEEQCERWLANLPQVAGLVMRGRGWLRRWGIDRIAVEPEAGRVLEVDASSFSQVNPSANQLLVAAVLENMGDLVDRDILEAYAGAGNFTAPLVRRGARVVAVESSTEACRSARRIAAAGLTGWSVEEGSVGPVLERLASHGFRYDAVLLDPPRSGAAEAIPAILRLAPRRVVYVSCDPATLARDLKSLSKAYRVESVQPIDMFPHTYHVETVVRCDRI